MILGRNCGTRASAALLTIFRCLTVVLFLLSALPSEDLEVSHLVFECGLNVSIGSFDDLHVEWFCLQNDKHLLCTFQSFLFATTIVSFSKSLYMK